MIEAEVVLTRPVANVQLAGVVQTQVNAVVRQTVVQHTERRPLQVAMSLIGAKGDRGESGLSIPLTNLVANQPINAFKVVTVAPDGMAVYASADNPAHYGRVIGVSESAALQGDIVRVQYASNLVNPGWNWPPGALLYLGLNGDLTTDQVGVFSKQLGFAKSPTEIIIKLGRAILRA